MGGLSCFCNNSVFGLMIIFLLYLFLLAAEKYFRYDEMGNIVIYILASFRERHRYEDIKTDQRQNNSFYPEYKNRQQVSRSVSGFFFVTAAFVLSGFSQTGERDYVQQYQ